MSWMQAAVIRPSEDVFDEDADELHLVQKEWKSTMDKRVKEGYRDGVEAGKELSLQQGFNQGYKQGAEMMMSCGQLKGILSALLSWCQLHGQVSALPSKINNLLDAVGKYEECVLKYMNYISSQPSVGELLDSVQDMDLSHTVSVENEFDGTEARRHCENDSELNENSCRSISEADFLQSDSSRRTRKHRDCERPTLAWLKEETASLGEQLGLSQDILQHIQQLES
nr:yae1 domain-containing protein 1 [Pelodiscus sinensis]XP_006124138.1 yae1 domain-containing protein 1 [Pelodiscus sinensis]XP_006124139.1 yae1 domain-containing protein 1 [Pelodiscus sinensis]XP_025040957.1 yae1 domain-containing protein 1 [Pelodiscus sinensis]|eukprot:XP_006124137.1 yae1 domain-containing protein 1 [Pelodiscus sinensis]